MACVIVLILSYSVSYGIEQLWRLPSCFTHAAYNKTSYHNKNVRRNGIAQIEKNTQQEKRKKGRKQKHYLWHGTLAYDILYGINGTRAVLPHVNSEPNKQQQIQRLRICSSLESSSYQRCERNSSAFNK